MNQFVYKIGANLEFDEQFVLIGYFGRKIGLLA